MSDVLDHLTLQLLPGPNPRLARRIREGSASEIVRHPREHADRLSPAALEALHSGRARGRAEEELRSAQRRGVQIVSIEDPVYPRLLREIHDPPEILYVWGSLLAGEGPQAVAVVGSRAATPAGRALARSVGRDLGAAGLTVLSGLARGIDAAAHAGALESGRTVAVLGSGLGRIYPDENNRLAERIASTGAVVSEFPLDAPPLRGHFPRRNRILAGWGVAVLVVEAGNRSGALVTARLALDEGRDVYAVPGHPGQEAAAGANQLIRDGAPLVRGSQDVLDELGVAYAPAPSAEGDEPPLHLLSRETPVPLDDLIARSGLATSALLQKLTALELAGRIRRFPGALYVRS